ncbi:MAG: hypothetical protein EBR86_12865 [Planctomycetia bacterium]|nr:hypothetical protein [Planctomycetia bacterium]
MRSLLSFAKISFRFATIALLLGSAARAETITWIDPPAARTVGAAEACGLKSVDVDSDTLTRDSIATLDAAGGDRARATDTAAPAAAADRPLPLAAGAATAVDQWQRAAERMEWMSVQVQSTESISIDPYPSWTSAAVVTDDVVTIASNSSDPFGQAKASGLSVDYRKAVAALDRRYWKW